MEDIMNMTTISVEAKRFEGEDDCLEAAADEIRSCLGGLNGWRLAARWASDEREEILLDVPEHALGDGLPYPWEVVACEEGEEVPADQRAGAVDRYRKAFFAEDMTDEEILDELVTGHLQCPNCSRYDCNTKECL